MLAGLGLAGGLLNAWFLLPDIAYAGQVAVAHSEPPAAAIWAQTREFNLPAVVLDPLRRVPRESTTPALYVQAPDWFIAWSLAAAALLLRRRAVAGALRRVWLGAIAILALLLGMIMVQPFWTLAVYPFSEIQFPYRLGTYVYYAAAGLVLVAALALQRVAAAGDAPRAVHGLRLALVAASAVSLALCLWQQWVPNTIYPHSYANRAEALASPYALPGTWYAGGDYQDWRANVIAVPRDRVLSIAPSAVRGDRFAAWMNVPPGPQPIATNISGGSYLVHIGGLRLVGRNHQDLAVVKRVHGGSGPVYVVVETTGSAVVELGRALSLLALLAVLAALLYAGARRRPRDRTANRVRAVSDRRVEERRVAEEPGARLLVPRSDVEHPELSIVIPALNEQLTISEFVHWCHDGLAKAGVAGEIVIVDSSTRRRPSTWRWRRARGCCARPSVASGERTRTRSRTSAGRYMLMGDADCTYDFRDLNPFVERFREGYEFIMGSRWKGSIEPGAMPWLHRYLGTPITTGSSTACTAAASPTSIAACAASRARRCSRWISTPTPGSTPPRWCSSR